MQKKNQGKNSNPKRNNTRKDSRTRTNNDATRISPASVQSQMYEALKYDASNIYFNNLVGTSLSTQDGLGSNFLPGIMIFDSIPNFKSRSDMINVSATSIYTFVRHANSGRTNYESSDLMLYLISLSEIFVGITELTRAYGLANYFTSVNLYSGKIIEALGFNPDTLRENLADIRYAINVLINKVKAFAVPRVFNYFDERISEFLNVYLDEPSLNAQMIAVRPSVLGRFDATTSTTGGSIQFINNSESNRDIYAQIDLINGMLDDLRRNEDMNIISGDILKAYGDNLFNLSPIDPEFKNEPVYDELSLIQFQNGHYPFSVSLDPLYQTDNRLHNEVFIGGPNAAIFDQFLSSPRLLNSPIEEIDPNLIFAISKYQMVTNGDDYELVSGNTTLLYHPVIHAIGSTGRLGQIEIDQIHVGEEMDAETAIMVSKYQHHPYIYSDLHTLPLGDMHFVAKLSTEDTNRMNDARFILAFQTLQMG